MIFTELNSQATESAGKKFYGVRSFSWKSLFIVTLNWITGLSVIYNNRLKPRLQEDKLSKHPKKALKSLLRRMDASRKPRNFLSP